MGIVSAVWSAVKAFFSGNSMLVYLIGGLALAVLLGWLFWSRASLKADLAQAEANLATMQTAYDASEAVRLEAEAHARRVESALAVRDEQLKQISASREADRRAWEEVKRNDKAARDWSAIPLPDAVRGLLQ